MQMFSSIQVNRKSESIVDQIKTAIFQKKLKPGDKLPSERSLMIQFQTSRITVREALRSLEQYGILEIKRGAEGGAFIRDPNTKFINNFLQDMFSLGKIDIQAMSEARLAVEPKAVNLACQRIDAQSLQLIEQNIREAEDSVKSGSHLDARLLNLEFHRMIASATENMVIFFIVDSIMDIMENNISTIPLSAEPVESTMESHWNIYQALKERDGEKAQAAMLSHIVGIQELLNRGTQSD